jgi:integrase
LSESQMRVHGKGNKIRCLPLASDTILLLDHYLRLERPEECGVTIQNNTRNSPFPKVFRSCRVHLRNGSGGDETSTKNPRHTRPAILARQQPVCRRLAPTRR